MVRRPGRPRAERGSGDWRVVVLSAAIFVEQPALHGGIATVVGKAEDHRVTRAAVGAVDIGILVARVRRIKQFCDTLVTHGKVRRDSDRRAIAAFAFADGEAVKAFGLDVCRVNFADASGGRGLRPQVREKGVEPGVFALKKDLDSPFAVEHPTGKLVSVGQAINEGTKADAHDAAHTDREG